MEFVVALIKLDLKDVVMSEIILEMKGINKFFSNIKALDNIDLDLRKGEVLGLVGQNGAGKSTLIKIISGIYKNDSGQIFIDGQLVEINNPLIARHFGIATIFQEFSLVPTLNISENIFLGQEDFARNKIGFINKKEISNRSIEILENLEIHLEPSDLVLDISRANQQLVEIAKSIVNKHRIYIMDEPTSSLTPKEVNILFQLIKKLKLEGLSIIYISHRLEEVLEIADRIYVLKNGGKVGVFNRNDIDIKKLTELVTSRIDEDNIEIKRTYGEEMLRIEDFSRKGIFENVNLSVSRGEILGICGLLGSGRSELVRSIYGVDRRKSGKIFFKGREVEINEPMDAVKLGIAYVTEDRKKDGLFLDLSILQNVTASSVKNMLVFLNFIDLRKEKKEVLKQIDNLNIKTDSIIKLTRYLSGGNQQKVLIAKCILSNAELIIFDEPTVGIDVGAKREILDLMIKLASLGKAIIAIFTEVSELLRVSDKIRIMTREGTITSEYKPGEITSQDILMMMISGRKSTNV
jgi:ribose transport system ATP-binding protein